MARLVVHDVRCDFGMEILLGGKVLCIKLSLYDGAAVRIVALIMIQRVSFAEQALLLFALN